MQTEKVIIRDFKQSDIESIIGIILRNYDAPTASRARMEIVSSRNGCVPRPQYKTAVLNKKPIGVAGFSESFFNIHIFAVFWVNVDAAQHGQGIGSALMHHVMECIWSHEEAKTSILTANDKNMPFYEQFGFYPVEKLGGTNLMLADKPPKKHKL